MVWFVLDEGIYRKLSMDNEGLLRSVVFPGLWLDLAAFWANDTGRQLTVLQAGIASPPTSYPSAQMPKD